MDEFSEDLFDSQEEQKYCEIYEDTEGFDSDDNNNYITFLKINKKMKPAVSTQKSYTQKSSSNSTASTSSQVLTTPAKPFVPYDKTLKPWIRKTDTEEAVNIISRKETKKISPTMSCITPTTSIKSIERSSIEPHTTPSSTASRFTYRPIRSEQSKLIETTTMPPPCPSSTATSHPQTTETNSQPDLVILMRSVLREVKLLRRDFQNNKCKCTLLNCNPLETSKLILPATSVEEFKNLENEVKQDSYKEKFLLQHFRGITDFTHEKYIRGCLKTIITNDAASSFSVHGQHGNIAIKTFTIINILKDMDEFSEDLFDSQEEQKYCEIYEDTEEFDSDDNNNYITFLKINKKMKPAVSTQKSYTQKSSSNSTASTSSQVLTTPAKPFVPYDKTLKPWIRKTDTEEAVNIISRKETKKISPTMSCITPTTSIKSIERSSIEPHTTPSSTASRFTYRPIRSEQSKLIETTTMPPPCPSSTATSHPQTTETNSQPDLVILMRSVLREVKLLRRDFQNNKCKCTLLNCNPLETSKLILPATSVEEFKNLENEVKQDSYKEKFLLQHFRGITDLTHEKYIRGCLKTIITNDAASSFSVHGQHGNIPIKTFTIINILKEETISKFNTARASDVEHVIKKWFQYAKDRCRRSQRNN